jgi:hypothetical protein
MGIHFLHCVHGGERMASHDVVQDVFAAIARDVRFHILQKQTHVFPPVALQSSRHRINIVLLVNGVRMFANVIVDPIHVGLVSQVVLSHGVVVTTAA